MTKVIGVRFRTAGKIYFFDPLAFEIKRGDHVIVETARGIEFGTVVSGVTEVEDEKVVQPLKPVLRIATQRDIEQEASNKEKEREAFKVCLEKIRKHELDMKLIDAEYTFDNNKVLFYFTADGRIDFRELVKDLASVFKTRIELRQIGVRDETKIRGGIGICGRPLCCHSYLSDFVPVSIKMAKEQNLSLNPTKISGVCGRLMCCLKNEEETYEELNRRLPGIGDSVTTEDGLRGEVQSVNVLRQLVKVVVEVGDEKEIKEYPVDKLSFRRKGGKREKVELSKEELQELERLESQELEADGAAKSEESKRQGGRNRQDGGNRHNDGNRQDNGQNRDRGSRRDNGHNQENRGHRENAANQESRSHWENAVGQDEAIRQNTVQGADGENFAGEEQQGGQQTGYNRQDNRNRRNNNRNRQNDGDRQNGNRRDDGNHQDNGNRQNDGNRQDNGNRQNGNRRDDGNRQDNGNRQHNGNRHERNNQAQGVDRAQGEQQNRNDQAMNGNQQENGERQGGKQRYDNRNYRRNRYDRRNRQEGQAKSNDSQS